MAYVKWVANTDRHNDWTTVLVNEDNTVEMRMGEPVEVSAERQKELEEQGRVFESSSKSDFDDFQKRAANAPVVGADIAGSAPVFANAGVNQTDQTSAPVQEAAPAPSGGSTGATDKKS